MARLDHKVAFPTRLPSQVYIGVVLLSALLGLGGCRPTSKDATGEVGPAPAPNATVRDTSPALLPDTAFRVEWGKADVSRVMKVGRPVSVQITVKNLSDVTWPDAKTGHPSGSGAGAIRLGYRWWRQGSAPGPVPAYPARRTNIPAPLPPGGSVILALDVDPPFEPGSYLLQLDLVHEFVTWFEAKGAAVLKVPVRVER